MADSTNFPLIAALTLALHEENFDIKPIVGAEMVWRYPETKLCIKIDYDYTCVSVIVYNDDRTMPRMILTTINDVTEFVNLMMAEIEIAQANNRREDQLKQQTTAKRAKTLIEIAAENIFPAATGFENK